MATPKGPRDSGASFSHSSKGRLTVRDRDRFPGDSLFDRIARAVCEAGYLPRKELYEAWEVARRVRRRFRGGRIVDLAAGHGLLGQILLILDNSSPEAILVDTSLPPSATKLRAALADAWPRLHARVVAQTRPLDSVDLEGGDLVVSSHACGAMTDVILERAVAAQARVAVLPCCQDLALNDDGGLSGWMDAALAVDAVRAMRLGQAGYRVWTQTIPAQITPKNRLLMAAPGQQNVSIAGTLPDDDPEGRPE